MGVYPITKTYAARHGYSVNIFPARGLVELRASYFSCHTYNKVATCACPVVCTDKRSLWVCNASFVSERWSVPLQLQPDRVRWRRAEDPFHEQDLYSCSTMGPKRDYLWGQLHGGNDASTCNWKHVFWFKPYNAFFAVGVGKAWGHMSIWDAAGRLEYLQTGILSNYSTV